MKSVLFPVLGLTLAVGTAWAQSADRSPGGTQSGTGTQTMQSGSPQSGSGQLQTRNAAGSPSQQQGAQDQMQVQPQGQKQGQAQGAGTGPARAQSSSATRGMQREDRAALESLPPSIRQQVMERYGPEQRVDEILETMILNHLAAEHATFRNLRREGNTYRADVMREGQWTVIVIDPQTLGG